MSTDMQLKGDSLRRQTDASAAYARQHGLDLVEELQGRPLHDIGKSAYTKENITSGALGFFLEQLKNGKIESDAVLLVESLDRLSRSNIFDALSQFLEIIKSGVEIVTLIDKQRYTKERIQSDPTALIISLTIMFRANEESETKSKRLSASWENKRKRIAEKPLTSKAPAWLSFCKASNRFDLIPDRVKIIQEIFRLCAYSTGLFGITKHLNSSGVAPFGHGKLWHRSYVKKIINNRAVLGEFQPHTKSNGKRIPWGEPIPNYFPAIIDENLFHLATAAISRRKSKSRGRKGDTFTNLLTGLTYCHHCGSRMVLRNRGDTPKGGKYLVCANQRDGGACTMSEWRFEPFQQRLFTHLAEIDFSQLLTTAPSNQPSIAEEIELLERRAEAAGSTIERLLDLVASDGLLEEVKDQIVPRINAARREKDEALLGLEDARARSIQKADAESALKSDTLKILLIELQNRPDDYLFRSSVNHELTRAIDRIVLKERHFHILPWEFGYSGSTFDNDEIAIEEIAFTYKKLHPKHEPLPLEKLWAMPSFQKYFKLRQQVVTIHFRLGSIKVIDSAEDIVYSYRPQSPLKSISKPTDLDDCKTS